MGLEAVQPRRLIRFGVFEADLDAGELRKRGARVRLQDRPFRILEMLLERSGRLVTRQELREHAEDDEVSSRCNHLPGRSREREIFEQAWQGIEAAREIKRMTLHYIGGKIVAEVTLPLSAASTPDEAGRLRQQMQAALAGNTHIERVDVYFS